jgi:Lysine methyltransferase
MSVFRHRNSAEEKLNIVLVGALMHGGGKEMTATAGHAARSQSTESVGNSETSKENVGGTDADTSLSRTERSSSNARWAILRNNIVKKSASLTTTRSDKTGSVEGSIHRFPGFNLLPRERLAREKAPTLQSLLTTVALDPNDDLVTILETSLLALTALRPSQWVWEFAVTFQSRADMDRWCTLEVLDILEHRLQSSSENPKHRVRLSEGSTWVQTNEYPASVVLKVVLAPFVPSCGIFCYKLPYLEASDGTNDPAFLYTRERLATTRTSLQELVSHHRHEGLDNTGNVCVWDSEKTLAYCLLKYLASHNLTWLLPSDQCQSPVNILELGAGMAGLAGLSLAQAMQQANPEKKFRVWLTDGHPQAAQNNRVHAHLMQVRLQTGSRNPVKCTTLPWSIDPPQRASRDDPPPCHIVLVSDCTHFQSFHAHLFFTLAYGVRVNGCIHMCQPHRGNSLQRFLDIVQLTANKAEGTDTTPLFSMEWLEIPELDHMKSDNGTSNAHYDPNIHCPRWLLLRKLRDVQERDRDLVLMHMAIRNESF